VTDGGGVDIYETESPVMWTRLLLTLIEKPFGIPSRSCWFDGYLVRDPYVNF